MESNKATFHHDLNAAQREVPPKNDFPQKHSHSKYNFVPLSHQQILQHGFKVSAHQHGVNLNQSACPQSSSQCKPPHIQQNTQRYQHQQPPKQVNIQPSEPDQQQYAYLQHYQNSKSANIQSMPQSSPSSPTHAMVTNSYHHLTENAPQIWVPHQRPVHYHCQATNEQKSQNTSPQIFSSSKTKDDIVEKKKLSGNPQLKSPSAKRPLEAPVTRQGWLHKQGSEMLMLWKKRWFVLSEYCLFYYKGPEEEKLLGSILLPSYSVSVCTPEDKVNRKYAFKCEHDNMRTYILAADSHETMMLWIHDLNLACLLQNNSENDQQSDKFIQSVSSNQLVDSRDPYSQNCKVNFPPVHVRSSSNMIDIGNQSHQELSQQEFNQPLYANAPPKPRRLTYDGGCSSPSSCEALLDYTYQSKNSPCNIMRNIPKSDTSDFRMTNSPEYILQHHLDMQDYHMSDQQDPRQNECHNFERRTPDTYSRSRINSSRVHSSTDYEDIYADQAVYKRPLSPIAYSNTKKTVPTQILNPLYRCYISDPKLDPKNLHRNPQNVISRPHSADFLEYELNHQHKNSVCAQKPRPKSSLGINGNYNDFDNYFYSEEKYAEKMRKSSQYLPKMLRYYCQSPCTVPCQWTHLSKHHAKSFPKNMLPQRSKSVISESSLSKEFDMDDKMSYPYEEFSRDRDRELRHPGLVPRQEIYSNSGRYQECDPFTRSVSARLTPENTYHMVKDGLSISREGYKKREESMKRLLEWKQRMLQSPLNRKVQNNRNYVNKDNYYKGCGTRYLHNGNQNIMYQVAPRSSSNLAHYNSCSSDDEEKEERSKESVHTQAGRTVDNNVETRTSTSPRIASGFLYNNPRGSVVSSHQHTDQILDIIDTNENKKDNSQKPEDTSCDNTTFLQPYFNRESSTLALVSNLRSEFSSKFKQSPAVTELRSTGALVKSLLAEFEKKSLEQGSEDAKSVAAPTSDIDTIIEENYMQMTPKNSILGPKLSNDNLATACKQQEENPYVEMSQSVNLSLLMSDFMDHNLSEAQPYELVCFDGNKIEPIYAELDGSNKTANVSESNTDMLPDILLMQKNQMSDSKSDSSDADDEASKELDSLGTPGHPRFSLSDTFRPASYYLGASQNAPEFQDSSDSELVSPPPIPTSPPPLDDIDSNDFCLSNLQEMAAFEQSNKKQTKIEASNVLCSKQDEDATARVLDAKKPSFFSSNSGLKDDQDSASITSFCSIGKDSVEKYSSGLSKTSDGDCTIRSKSPNKSLYETSVESKPATKEFCDEVPFAESNVIVVKNLNFNKYLKHLQDSNISLFSNDENLKYYVSENKTLQSHFHDYENLYVSNYSGIGKNLKRAKEENLNANLQKEDTEIGDVLPGTCHDSGSLFDNSNTSTYVTRAGSSMSVQEFFESPTFHSRPQSTNVSFNQTAPYYYSDLSVNTADASNTSVLTLNNQRYETNGNKRDISHIINPIKCNSFLRCDMPASFGTPVTSTHKLAAEARSVSADFLNLTDKSGHIDEKNIYESDTLRRIKISDVQTLSVQSDPETINIFPASSKDKFITTSSDSNVKRSHSLEGLLENVLADASARRNTEEVSAAAPLMTDESKNDNSFTEGSFAWEEDTVWHDRLRSASQRHTKSMDDLEIECNKKAVKKSTRGLTRGVTYVNDNVFNMSLQDKLNISSPVENNKKSGNKNENKHENSFILDREKLRQWDLLSSAPSDDQLLIAGGSQTPKEETVMVETASGSMSINTREMFPRTMGYTRHWMQNSHQSVQSESVTNLSHCNDDNIARPQQPGYYVVKRTSQADTSSETDQKENWPEKMNVSAGELLGRTHEELVLLLIQLRRQSSYILNAIEYCYNEIEKQPQLQLLDHAKRMENLQKLEQIKQHLIELEKQYEKGKPLINLVDNMVKLGSLYRTPNDRNYTNSYLKDRLEFSQQVQEKRLLDEERRDWNRLNPSHLQLQEKVQQLYHLDRLINDESRILQNLQQDKEDIEKALGELQYKLNMNKNLNNPTEVEQAQKQQLILENELGQVHDMLAQNSRKLEETVAGNARLEQELLVFKQKLQISRQQRSSPQFSNAGDSLPCIIGTSAMLESDLQKVQQKVGDLQKQRQELSMQVRQLTDRSSNHLQQMKQSNSEQNIQCLGTKKKISSVWRETDLDTMNIIDHGEHWDVNSSFTPLYINTDLKQNESDFYSKGMKSSDDTSEDTMQNIVLTSHEKQEIKTVRIVKRESERRQRDREKITTGKWDPVIEEDDCSQNPSISFRPATISKTHTVSDMSLNVEPNKSISSSNSNFQRGSLSSPNSPQAVHPVSKATSSSEGGLDKSPELSPVFKSETARQIITEMSVRGIPKQTNKRLVPKEKRRHYTAPHNNQLAKSIRQFPTSDSTFDNRVLLEQRRARDDLDMERALRQRIDAPDVVRSTLSNKELKYNERTIDNILGTPNKIAIPERYIPEQVPQLTAEEQEQRSRKVESIKKMLSDTTVLSSSAVSNLSGSSDDKDLDSKSNKVSLKMVEEKKQREHLLQLNQILAQQVMEMSKIVAVKALVDLPLESVPVTDEDSSSPEVPLPLYQQRDNFYY